MNILIIASNIQFQELESRFLTFFEGNEVKHINQISSLEEETLISLNPDVILAEVELPDFDHKKLRNFIHEKARLIKLIFLADEMNERRVIQYIEDCGSDYVLKSNLTRLELIFRKNGLKQNENGSFITKDVLELLINGSPNIICIKDLQGRYEYCNKATLDFFDVKGSDEIIGKSADDFFTPDSAKMIKDEDFYVINNRIKVINEEHRVHTLSGLIRYWRITRFPIYNSEGEISHVAVIKDNITDVSNSPTIFKASDKIINSFVSVTSAIIYNFIYKDEETIPVWVSANVMQLGYTVEEVLTTGWWNEVIHPDDRFSVVAMRPEMFEKGKIEREYRVKQKGGSYIWIRDEVTLIKDENNKAIELIGSWIDITERVRNEKALLESKKQLTHALEISQMAYWEYDIHDDVVFLNDHFYSLFYTTVKKEGGYFINLDQFLEKFVHQDDASYVKYQIGQCIKIDTEENQKAEYRILYSNGTIGVANSKFSVARNDEGKAIKLFCITQDITERKHIEEALLKSESQLSNAMTIANLGYWELDIPTFMFTFNDHAYAVLHTTEEKVGGYLMSAEDYANKFIYPEDADVVKEETIKAIETTDPYFTRSLEHRIVYENGEIGYVAIRYNIVKDDDGKTIKTYGVSQNITERKKAEEALKKSEKLLTNALEIAKLAYSEYDSETGLLTFNDQHFSVLRTSFEKMGTYSMTSEKFSELFIHPDDRTYITAEMQKAFSSSDTNFNKIIEHKVIYGDGDIGHMAVRVSVTKDLNSGRIKAFIASQDITEQKKSELALKQSEYFLRKSQSVANVGSYNFDIKSTRWHSSQTLDKIYGIDKDFRKNLKNWLRIIHPDFREEMRSYILESISNRKTRIDKTYKIVRLNDGAERWVQVIGDIEFDHELQPATIIGTVQDITERVIREMEKEELEEKIKSRNNELEKMILDLKKMQSTLVQTEKMASLGQLSAGIAHEINNPLAFVSSNINRLNEYYRDSIELLNKWNNLKDDLNKIDKYKGKMNDIESFSEEIDFEFIQTDFDRMMVSIQDGIGRIKKIVEGMRGFSHLGNDEFTNADINKAIDDTLTIVWNEIKYKAKIEKDYNILPAVKCNISEIKQVFVNLLVNAAHAIEKEGIIKITTGVTDNNIYAKIEDNGCGISKEKIKKIFDPFFTTKKVGEGSGLGLWISSSIIEKHGGNLKVESEVGKGTTFIIELPMSHVESNN